MKIKKETHPSIPKLDLSFGNLPAEQGFVKPKGFDPEKVPWRIIPDESVEEACSAYLLNRIPGPQRMAWMAEAWRVLKPNAKILVIVPYWASPRATQDPYSVWPPLSENSFLYFNKSFREQNQISLNGSGYSDFDFVYGYQLEADTALRNTDTQPFWVKHYLNAVNDLHMTLTKRPL